MRVPRIRNLILRSRLNLIGLKKESVPWLPQQSHILTGIIFNHDRDVEFAFVVLLDRFHDGNFLCERHIKDIATLLGVQPDAGTCSHHCVCNTKALSGNPVFKKMPIVLVHDASFLLAPSPRMMPCSFAKCSGGSISVLSRIWRVRSSALSASFFSSSVSVRMRRAKISSISVPSKRS